MSIGQPHNSCGAEISLRRERVGCNRFPRTRRRGRLSLVVGTVLLCAAEGHHRRLFIGSRQRQGGAQDF